MLQSENNNWSQEWKLTENPLLEVACSFVPDRLSLRSDREKGKRSTSALATNIAGISPPCLLEGSFTGLSPSPSPHMRLPRFQARFEALGRLKLRWKNVSLCLGQASFPRTIFGREGAVYEFTTHTQVSRRKTGGMRVMDSGSERKGTHLECSQSPTNP